MIDSKGGTLLVKAARKAIEKFYKKDLKRDKIDDKKLNEKHGVFVTIKKFPSNELRGCIGFISPLPLYKAVQDAAVEAAFNDPRFPSLDKRELDNVIIEVSVMTEPVLVPTETMENEIKIGRDGLIISNLNYSGLLLPQVPIEHHLDIDGFLKCLCQKAGMPHNLLKDEHTKLWRFQCQIFRECEPCGKVEVVA